MARLKKELTDISKTISYALRHKPEEFGLELDVEGWADTLVLVNAMQGRGQNVTLADVIFITENNSKKRFELSADNARIRALQGHTAEEVKRDFPAAKPIGPLFHGTPTENLPSIWEQGLKRMARHHVHLSATMSAAHIVGRRYNAPYTILRVDALEMVQDGFQFYLSENGVWLIDHVPSEYITSVFNWTK